MPRNPEPEEERDLDGLPIAVDADAESADPELPAFLARPAGAPVYHGFPVLDDVEVDGFRLGIITDFEHAPSNSGDAFIVAPDNSRAGLVWTTVGSGYPSPGAFSQVREFEPDRWGVWEIAFDHPMRTRDDARHNLAAILPRLREAWIAWKRQFGADVKAADDRI